MQHVSSRAGFPPATFKCGSHSIPAVHLPLRALRRRYPFANRLLRAGALVAFAMSFAWGNAHARPTAPAPVAVVDPYAAFIAEASERFAIPSAWLRAVMHVESRGDAKTVSPKGAMGLMQLMPDTWSMLRARYHLGNDPYDPHDNIVGGAAYLRQLFDRFGAPGFLAAYNAGPKRFQDCLAGLRPLHDETKRYLSTLAQMLPDLPTGSTVVGVARAGDWQTVGLFPGSPTASSSSNNVPVGPASDNTPVPQTFALAPQTNGLFVPVRMTGQR